MRGGRWAAVAPWLVLAALRSPLATERRRNRRRPPGPAVRRWRRGPNGGSRAVVTSTAVTRSAVRTLRWRRRRRQAGVSSGSRRARLRSSGKPGGWPRAPPRTTAPRASPPRRYAPRSSRRTLPVAGRPPPGVAGARGTTGRSGDAGRLLPLDRAGRLGRDVVGHPVDARDLVDDAARQRLEHVVGQAGPVGGHGVLAGDRPDDDRVGVGALVAHHAHRPDVGQHGERLPDLAFETCPAQLLADDVVGVLEHGDLVGRDVADDAHGEPRAGERLAPHDLLGQAELLADAAHLVLEQGPERLDELEGHVLGQAAHVVVALDGRRAGPAARLDHVGIKRALNQVACVLETAGGLLEDADEQLADDLALVLGVADPGQAFEVAVGCPHVDQLDVLVALERLDDLLGLAPAQQPGV